MSASAHCRANVASCFIYLFGVVFVASFNCQTQHQFVQKISSANFFLLPLTLRFINCFYFLSLVLASTSSLCQHPTGVCAWFVCVCVCLLEQQCNIKKSHFAVDLFCNLNRTFRHFGTFKCKACKTMLRILNLPKVQQCDNLIYICLTTRSAVVTLALLKAAFN